MLSKLTEWIRGPRIMRAVSDGRVFCPVRQQDIDVDRCFACSFAAGVELDGDRNVTDIVCNPTYGSLTGTYL